jgi:Methylamine utilisation protein MauE.
MTSNISITSESPSSPPTRLAQAFDWIFRLALALVFAYAAIEKIIDPAGFAQTIDNYRLFPAFSIGPLAILLPWLEMITALAVIIGGPWKRPAALILAVLLISFMLAVGFNLARGLDFECGCFGSDGRQAGLKLLVQDGLLLICAAYVLTKRDQA